MEEGAQKLKENSLTDLRSEACASAHGQRRSVNTDLHGWSETTNPI